MSDERLREFERRWKETGSVEDEAAYLLERVRAGELTQERLEMAAYCGHEAARFASGTTEPPIPKDDGLDRTSRWESLLTAGGCAVIVRACVSAGQVLAESEADVLEYFGELRLYLEAAKPNESPPRPSDSWTTRAGALAQLSERIVSSNSAAADQNPWLEAEDWCAALFLDWGQDDLASERERRALDAAAESIAAELLKPQLRPGGE